MKSVTIFSHHQQGGGKPLDSFWFSQQECRNRAIDLKIFWTQEKTKILQIIKAKRIIFDGIPCLVNYRGYRFYLLSQLLKKQTAIYWHETEWGIQKAIERQPAIYPVVDRLLSNPNIIHFHVCKYGAKMLQDTYHINAQNIYVLNNISNSSPLLKYSLPLDKEENLVVACGLVSKKKGTDYFLQIAEKVIRQNPQVKFVWIGKFGEEEYCEGAIAEQLQKHGLENYVTFTGALENPASIMAKADLFILTSRDDPMPKVLMEALALGKPCLAFGICGVPELLGEYGKTFALGDISAFTKAILKHLQTPEDETSQLDRRQWYEQNYSPTSFGIRFAKALDWWDSRSSQM